MKEQERIALFDMDGTLCDYESRLIADLNDLNSPQEQYIDRVPDDDVPLYLRKRVDLIRSSVEWWATLPKFQLGFDIWELTNDLGFRRMILTAGPKRNPNAWSGKKIWIDGNLGTNTDITITRDKGLVYGKVLVDDWPDYILRWLEWRPRGLVIMPASKTNENFKHEQVIRYTGHNLAQVEDALASLLKKED
ncbi:MAG: hypothetical protein PHF86_09460 [Candidatus Nanoarchaeia archaeon]|nr:hypothetical protein [Candidatus Nanoarchaeia archaeon]